jgi:hypothetical protein
MDYDKIEEAWEKTNISKPKVLLLLCGSKFYAVVEDHTNIVVIAYKNKIVYAITKNRISLIEKDGIPLYYLENNKHLKIISCTRETIEKRHKDQWFVINNIVDFLI